MDNSVIRKLADIDHAACTILDDAEKEKRKLAERFREKTEEYDRKVDEETERKLGKIRSDLERENSGALEKLESDMERSLAFIRKNYENQIDVRSDEVVAGILNNKKAVR